MRQNETPRNSMSQDTTAASCTCGDVSSRFILSCVIFDATVCDAVCHVVSSDVVWCDLSSRRLMPYATRWRSTRSDTTPQRRDAMTHLKKKTHETTPHHMRQDDAAAYRGVVSHCPMVWCSVSSHTVAWWRETIRESCRLVSCCSGTMRCGGMRQDETTAHHMAEDDTTQHTTSHGRRRHNTAHSTIHETRRTRHRCARLFATKHHSISHHTTLHLCHVVRFDAAQWWREL